MKKTLAIVLALVMVLAMIPAMNAAITEYKTITDKAYGLFGYSYNDGGYQSLDSKGNTFEYKYNWEEIKADQTGKWTDDVKMGAIRLHGWDAELVSADKITSITVDGKELKVAADAKYEVGFTQAGPGYLTFPVELTKAGYTDTYVITVVGQKGDKQITETAKVTVKLVNTAEYKDVKTAVITNVEAADKAKLDAYIVGSKIYLDYVNATADAVNVKFTFADENKAAFSGIVYAYDATDVFEVTGDVKNFVESYKGWEGDAVRLDKSAATYTVDAPANTNEPAKDVQFKLETKADLYETKKYDVVARYNVAKEDPKGIYFAETTKTIAMGETYAPIVMGVKTGKPVDATLVIKLDETDKEVIDFDADGNVVGTREGVAFITAQYSHYVGGEKEYVTYTSASMKITVTLPGESIPALDPSAEVYYVTCRALNVRAGAGTSYKKVDLIHRGDAVKVVELKNGWAKLADGTYVCAKYIAK